MLKLIYWLRKIKKKLARICLGTKVVVKRLPIFTSFRDKAIDGDMLKNKKELSRKVYYYIQTPTKLKGIIKVRTNHLGGEY